MIVILILRAVQSQELTFTSSNRCFYDVNTKWYDINLTFK